MVTRQSREICRSHNRHREFRYVWVTCKNIFYKRRDSPKNARHTSPPSAAAPRPVFFQAARKIRNYPIPVDRSGLSPCAHVVAVLSENRPMRPTLLCVAFLLSAFSFRESRTLSMQTSTLHLCILFFCLSSLSYGDELMPRMEGLAKNHAPWHLRWFYGVMRKMFGRDLTPATIQMRVPGLIWGSVGMEAGLGRKRRVSLRYTQLAKVRAASRIGCPF